MKNAFDMVFHLLNFRSLGNFFTISLFILQLFVLISFSSFLSNCAVLFIVHSNVIVHISLKI